MAEPKPKLSVARGIHPAANVFRLMSDAELEGLTREVKRLGLLVPLAVHRESDLIVDGRNRALACERSGVEPRYEFFDGDPTELVAAFSLRRHRPAGERAVAAAEAWGLAIEEGRAAPTRGGRRVKGERFPIPDPPTYFAGQFGSNEKYVKQARAVVEEAPELADAVKSGVVLLGDAYKDLQERRAKKKREREEREQLAREREDMRKAHADLIERVERDELSLADAIATAHRREREREQQEQEQREKEQKQREVATTRVLSVLKWFDLPDPEGAAKTGVRYLDEGIAAREGETMSAARVRSAARVLDELADAMEERA